MSILLFSLLASIASLGYGAFLIWQVLKKPTGYGLHVSLNVKMKAEIEKIALEE